MRLNLEGSAVRAPTARLVVSGVIDWSTIVQFRAALSRYLVRPRPDVLVDLTGLLSWSPQAQATLVRAIRDTSLRGGRLRLVGLTSIPRWEARESGLPGLDQGSGRELAAWDAVGADVLAPPGA